MMATTTEKLFEEPCNHWPKNDDTQWLQDITSNLFLALAFSISYFVEESWTWIRVLLIIGHAIAANLSVNRCQIKAFIWAILLIAVNVYRLLKTAYNHRPSKVPRYLHVSFLWTFSDLSRSIFSSILLPVTVCAFSSLFRPFKASLTYLY